MNVLLTISSLAKTTGGPATVVQHLAEHLAQQGTSVTVLTHKPAPGQTEVLPRHPQVRVVHVSFGAKGGLGGEFRKGLESLLALKKMDVMHDFGIWMPSNHAVAAICHKFKLPLVTSPCGMLAPWALRHNAWKKRLAWWLYQRRDLARTAVLVATADQEVRDIRHRVPGKNIALIPNGVDLLDEENQKSEIRERGAGIGEPCKKVVFLGRIHPVKGLNNLIAAWHQVRPSGWQCILAGPNEAGHRAELATQLRTLQLEQDFLFPGLMEDERKWTLLKEADLFVLPSFTENFGMVVVEALATGVPVITTKGTPWRELGTRKCGWWVDIGVEPLAAALRQATSLSDSERQAMGQRGRDLVKEKYGWLRIAGNLLEVYQWVVGRGPQPGCVQT